MALKKTFVFALLIAAMAASAASAATVSFTIKLYDTTGNATTGGNEILPTSPGVYDLLPGTQFRTRVFAVVNSPNSTDNLRDNSTFDLNNKPLGVQNITGDLVTSGVSIADPQPNGALWKNFGRLGGNALVTGFTSPGSVNLIDKGSDGDLDPAAAGVINNNLDLADDGSQNLSTVQVGATGVAALFQGWYTATAPGTTQLTFNPTTVNVFAEVAGAGTALAAEVAAFTSTPITINVIGVPEPSTFALAGIGLLGLAFIRRRK